MKNYRAKLPQTSGNIFLTDGGIETTLIFLEGIELPYFAAFDLLKDSSGRDILRRYFETYAALAVRARTGFILETPTWRASRDWGHKLSYSDSELAEANRRAIEMMVDIREEFQLPTSSIVISGCIGPRGDGYQADVKMDAKEAAHYHEQQIRTFSDTAADMINGITLTYPEEAIGITLAAQACNMPVVISFTTETDGKLPDGETLGEAINIIDSATNNGPSYYMVSCTHPDHFYSELNSSGNWQQRIRGLRANASRKSHAELDESVELDSGNPEEFASLYSEIISKYPHINVLGGCCGTDHRHIHKISELCMQ